MVAKSLMNNHFVTMFIFAVILSSCSFNSAPRQSTPETDFKAIILKENWFDLEIGYEAEKAQSALSSADISEPVFVIGKDQIEKYDWDLQTITLTSNATNELGEALLNIGAASAEIENLNNLKESFGWGNPIERALYIHPFIVQVDNQFIYGGIFLDATSQMAINFPVARVTISEGKVVIALLPTHMPFVMIDPIDESGNLRQPIIADEAKHDVQQLDFFPDWSTELATSAISEKFRAIIRDKKIRLIFEEAAGK
ncbi:MAG: hypothetical protein KF770_08990 [Anaerolineae bacterium]|nr:hypothetical protein [Anaerolineae bacterium]